MDGWMNGPIDGQIEREIDGFAESASVCSLAEYSRYLFRSLSDELVLSS